MTREESILLGYANRIADLHRILCVLEESPCYEQYRERFMPLYLPIHDEWLRSHQLVESLFSDDK